MRLLVPGDSGLPLGTELDLSGLVTAYAAPRERWFRCNMVTTLDGGANGTDGKSGTINTDADHVVFDLLRALSDVVVVGAGTVRVEGYPALSVDPSLQDVRRRAGLGLDLPLVAVSRSGDVPPTLRESSDGHVLLATCSSSPGLDEARGALGADGVLICGDEEVDLQSLVAQLHERGWHRLLTEGGPRLTGSFLGAGLLDELCFTIAPRVVGGLHPRPVGPDAAPTELDLEVLVEENGTLMGRWFVGSATST
jgi:riboflavin biosynthesis pyrimidine reductase